jgi:PKD repeat protein
MKPSPLNPFLARLALLFALAAILLPAELSATHPRLLFDAADVPALRARAQQEPFARMLESVEWIRDHDPFFTVDGQDQFHKDFGNPAILYLFTGDNSWADLARDETLYYLSRTEWWANTSYSALRRGALSRGASISYDFCHDAWHGQNVPASVTYRGQTRTIPAHYVGRPLNEVVSEAILANAESLMNSGGSGWPGSDKYGNNWYAVRYGGAGIGYLATDHPFDESRLTSAINEVVKYVETTLTKQADAQGWNPEGHGYAMYPGQYAFLFELLLNRHRGRSLGAEAPAFERALWAIYQGGLPYATRYYPNNSGELNLGFHPDFTDDNVNWNPEGTANLAFVIAPEAFIPGLKWIYRRVFGDLGDNRWDTSSMGGLYALLFYPDDLAEENPADIPGWGLNYHDPAFGMTLLRNRFADEDDALVMLNGKYRSAEGGHNGPDGLGLRIAGEGHLWTTGSGRTTNPRGQTIVFKGDPNGAAGDRSVYSERFGTPREVYLRDGGGGIVAFNAFRSDTGVRDHTRRVVTDYDTDIHGATSVVIVEDQTADGLYWRLNTPGSNTISLLSDGFVITSPEGPGGPRLVGKVLQGDPTTLRTGTFARGSANFFFDGQTWPDNNWVDFVSEDGVFVVALMLLPGGAPAPDIAWAAGMQDTLVVQSSGLPGRTYAFTDETVVVSGWERPDVFITSPSDGQEFTGGSADFVLSGTSSDPDGAVERVDVYIDGVYAGEASLDMATGDWSYPVSLDELGDYELAVRATDNSLEYRDSEPITVRVTWSLPPRVKLTSPAIYSAIPAGQQVQFSGTVFDEDGVITSVAIFNNGAQVGTAAVDEAAGTWTWNWTSLPFGRQELAVRATDNSGDVTWTAPLPLTGSRRFGPVPYEGDAANWGLGHLSNRWSVASDGVGMGYYLGSGGTSDGRHGQNMILDRSMDGDFRLEFDFKTDIPLAENPQYQIFFGQGVWVRMTTRGANASTPLTRLSSDNAATQIQMADSQHQRWIAYAHGAGISSEDWQHVVAERTGNHMRIEVDGIEILNTAAPDAVLLSESGSYQPGKTFVWTPRQDAVALEGNVGVGNFFNTYTQFGWFDDVSLTATNASPGPQVTLDSPSTASIVAVGNPATFSGTFDHPAGRPTWIELYAGGERVGWTVPDGDSWSLDWTPPLAADYALRVRALDSRLDESWTQSVYLRATADGTGALTPPQLSLLQPSNGELDVPAGAGAVLEVSGMQGSAALSHVSIFRDDEWVMDADRVGTQARWVAALPTAEPGDSAYIARVHDHLGVAADSAPVAVSVFDRAPATPVRINFQPSGVPPVSGYYRDSADPEGNLGFGLHYGWQGTTGAYERNALTSADRRYATGVIGSLWRIALDPGYYEVRVVSGNPAASGSITSGLFVQGQAVYTSLPLTAGQVRDDLLPQVEVIDGHLTISANPDGLTGQTVGLYFIEITPTDGGNLAPLVSWQSPTGDAVFAIGQVVPLSVEAWDVDGSVAQVEFFADGASIGFGVQTGGTDLWTFDWSPAPALEGYVNLAARATDDAAASRTTDPLRRVIIGAVSNQPPQALFTASPNYGDAPLVVSFNAAASGDPDGSVAGYAWDFGNGASGSGVTATQTYHTPGIYEVVLTVTDDQGAIDTRSAWITVTDPGAGGQGITLLQQPQGGEVSPGESLALSVEAIGQGPLTFEWFEGPAGDAANSILRHVDGPPNPAGQLLAHDAIAFTDEPGGYVAGSGINGKNPPLAGWSGPWSGGHTNRPLSIYGSLEYADAFGNELVVGDGRIRQSTTMSNAPTRGFDLSPSGPLAPVLGGGKIASGSVFFSHLLRWERTTSFSFGLRDGSSHSARLYMDTADGNAWKIAVGNEVRGLTEPLGSHTVHLIVWEINYTEGVTRFYLNPPMGSVAAVPMFEIPAALPVTNFHFGGNREYDLDEARLGTIFAAVTPHLTPAQPVTSAWTPPAPDAPTGFWVRVSNPVATVASEGAMVVIGDSGPSYADWALGLPSDQRDAQADPLGCGISNSLRFALGLDFSERPGPAHRPVLERAEGWLSLSWPLREGVAFEVEASGDMAAWFPLESHIPGASVEQTAGALGMTRVNVSLPDAGPVFLRLWVADPAGD